MGRESHNERRVVAPRKETTKRYTPIRIKIKRLERRVEGRNKDNTESMVPQDGRKEG